MAAEIQNAARHCSSVLPASRRRPVVRGARIPVKLATVLETPMMTPEYSGAKSSILKGRARDLCLISLINFHMADETSVEMRRGEHKPKLEVSARLIRAGGTERVDSES